MIKQSDINREDFPHLLKEALKKKAKKVGKGRTAEGLAIDAILFIVMGEQKCRSEK